MNYEYLVRLILFAALLLLACAVIDFVTGMV